MDLGVSRKRMLTCARLLLVEGSTPSLLESSSTTARRASKFGVASEDDRDFSSFSRAPPDICRKWDREFSMLFLGQYELCNLTHRKSSCWYIDVL